MSRFQLVGAVVIAAVLTACGGGTNAPTALPPTTTVPASDNTATQSYLLTGNAQTIDLPNIAACKGRVTLPPANTLSPATTLSLTTSLTAPAGVSLAAPAGTSLRPSSARPLASGQLNVLCYVTFAVSTTVTYPTLPGFAVTVAPTISTAGIDEFFYYAISDPGGPNAALNFRTEGPATVTGQTLTFTGSSPNPLTLLAHQKYIFAFYGTIAATTEKLYVSNAIFCDYAIYCGEVLVFEPAHGNALVNTLDVGYSGGGHGGAAFDANGKLFVADYYNNIVGIYDPVNTYGYITGVNFPTGVALDASGKLYVANGGQGFGYGGTSISILDTAHGYAALPSITGGGLNGPIGVAVGANGKLYAANSLSNSVSVFDTLHGNAPLPPITGGGLDGPGGVAIAADGKLYVVSGIGVAIFDTTHGNAALTPITKPGLTPQYVAIDGFGKLYVTNRNGSVSIFDTAHGNTALPPITYPGLYQPTGIAIH